MTASITRKVQESVRKVLLPDVSTKELWSWAMYDFANSGYTTVVITTVFSAYFVGVVAEGKSWATLLFTAAMSLSYLIVMLTMPAIGSYVDANSAKKKVLMLSTLGCVVATAFLSLAGPNTLIIAIVALIVSNFFYCIGESLIASFLPSIARDSAVGRVSGWGWGIGYFGGMITLGLSLWLVFIAESNGISSQSYVPWIMILTASMFMIAALPTLVFLKERTNSYNTRLYSSAKPFSELLKAWQITRLEYPNFFRLLVCGACYHAGISVVITLSSVYATQVMGFSMAGTMMMVFTVNIAAAAGALSFGHVQDNIGHKRALTITLGGWVLMVVTASIAVNNVTFWAAATLAGLCMGTSQSAGRAMVASMAPKERPAEFYALWTFAIQLAAVIGPITYGLITWATLGQHRIGLLATGLFFIAGLMVLRTIEFTSPDT